MKNQKRNCTTDSKGGRLSVCANIGLITVEGTKSGNPLLKNSAEKRAKSSKFKHSISVRWVGMKVFSNSFSARISKELFKIK